MRTRPLPTASSITSPLDDPSAKKVTPTAGPLDPMQDPGTAESSFNRADAACRGAVSSLQGMFTLLPVFRARRRAILS